MYNLQPFEYEPVAVLIGLIIALSLELLLTSPNSSIYSFPLPTTGSENVNRLSTVASSESLNVRRPLLVEPSKEIPPPPPPPSGIL